MIDPVVSMTYMLAGYSVIFLVLAIYLASLFVRRRRLQRELEMLSESSEDRP